MRASMRWCSMASKRRPTTSGPGAPLPGTVDALVVAAQFFPCLGLEATLPSLPQWLTNLRIIVEEQKRKVGCNDQ